MTPPLAVGLLVGSAGCSVTSPDEASSQQSVVVVDALFENLGARPVGSTSSVHPIDVRPDQGNNADYITAVTPTGAGCPGFVVNAPGLPAYLYRTCFDPDCIQSGEQGYSFNTLFRPTAPGAVSCPVVISTFDPIWGTTSSLTVTLLGTGL